MIVLKYLIKINIKNLTLYFKMFMLMAYNNNSKSYVQDLYVWEIE